MTAMVQEFDGVRELSMDEVDAVAGGLRTRIVIHGMLWILKTFSGMGEQQEDLSSESEVNNTQIEHEGDIYVCIGYCPDFGPQ